MERDVQELLDLLYNMVTDAWGLPLGAEKCVVERNKVLEYIEDIRAQLPAEIAEAKRLVEARAEFINNAKREAESIRKVAEDRARQMVDEQEIVRSAKAKAEGIMRIAEEKSAELRRTANEYTDDALRRTEEAIAEALDEVRQSRMRFRSVAGNSQPSNPTRDIVPD